MKEPEEETEGDQLRWEDIDWDIVDELQQEKFQDEAPTTPDLKEKYTKKQQSSTTNPPKKPIS